MITTYLPNIENMIAIYCLVDPRKPDLVRYVGQSGSPRTRHIQHVSELLGTPKGDWIESIRQHGIMPQMIILEYCPANKADQREMEYINKYSSNLLTNLITSPKKENKLTKIINLSPRQLKEKEMIETTLNNTGYNKQATAKQLYISRSTLYNKMIRYGIEK